MARNTTLYHCAMSAKHSTYIIYNWIFLNVQNAHDNQHDDNTIKTSGIVPVVTIIKMRVYKCGVMLK